ncbi:MFS transporter, partial [Chloroflexota bacterium]
MPSVRYRWVILILIYICVLAYVITLQSVPPILPSIIVDLRLTHAEAGLLMSLFSVPGILLGILAGSLSDRLGAFKIGSVSFILLIIGTLIFATSNVFLLAGLGRVIAGIGA